MRHLSMRADRSASGVNDCVISNGNIMACFSFTFLACLLGGALVTSQAVAAPAIMVVGIDTKFWIDDAVRVFKPDSGDLVQVYDLSDPAHPQLIRELLSSGRRPISR
jgi:hypothetical protein